MEVVSGVWKSWVVCGSRRWCVQGLAGPQIGLVFGGVKQSSWD